jgi:hypothetical protein
VLEVSWRQPQPPRRERRSRRVWRGDAAFIGRRAALAQARYERREKD